MKNRLRLCMLLSLFTSIALHTSDYGYLQKVTELVCNKVDHVALIEVDFTTMRSSPLYVYVPQKTKHPICMCKPVMTHDGVNYMLTNIAFDNQRNLTQLTLTPKNSETNKQ